MTKEHSQKASLKLYLFDALDARTGQAVRGSWWAESLQQAVFWLENQGFSQVQARISPQTLETVTVNDAFLALFFRQLATMFRSGIPLTEALRLASYSEDPRLCGVCLMLAEQLDAGHTLSSAMRLFPSIFDPVIVGLISAAENSGKLATTLARLAQAQERRSKFKRNVISAITYPAILMTATAALTLLFVFYIFPLNQGLFASMHLNLPAFTRTLLYLIDLISSPWCAVFLFAMFGYLLMLARSQDFRRKLRFGAIKALLRVGPVRSLVMKARALRMLEILGLLLAGGGTVDLALRTMIAASPDPDQKKVFVEIRQQVIQGASFGEAVLTGEFFPPLVASMMQVGYETGRLAEMAERCVVLCEEDVELALETASALIEPLLLVVAGGLAGAAVISSALPALQLLNSL